MGPARATLKLVASPLGEGRQGQPDPASPAGVDLPTLFHLYYGWVAALAARMSGRTGDVEDIVQDVFFLCARKIHTIPTMADAKPWLRTVTVRVVRKRLRAEKWRAWFRSSDDGIAELPYRGLAPDERAMLEGLYAALAALPVEERLAWTLRHVEGSTLEEVAAGCGCSLATAKRRIARASRTLEEGGHAAALEN
jgi:RNA polymerase sigma-70 factor, ECF subfamily